MSKIGLAGADTNPTFPLENVVCFVSQGTPSSSEKIFAAGFDSLASLEKGDLFVIMTLAMGGLLQGRSRHEEQLGPHK